MVEQIVTPARWTGSARNRQPWRVAAVFDQSLRTRLSQLGAYAQHLADAPAVLVLLCPAVKHLDTDFDLGRLAQSITLLAAEAGLGTCVVSLYPERNALLAAELVSAPPGWTAQHAIALGYPAPRPTGRSAVPRGRRPLADVMHVALP